MPTPFTLEQLRTYTVLQRLFMSLLWTRWSAYAALLPTAPEGPRLELSWRYQKKEEEASSWLMGYATVEAAKTALLQVQQDIQTALASLESPEEFYTALPLQELPGLRGAASPYIQVPTLYIEKKTT